MQVYQVRRPNQAEYFLGKQAFVVTAPNGQTETVTWRSTSAGIVWNQKGGFLQEATGFASGKVDFIQAAMNFMAAEFAAKNPAPVAAIAPREDFCKRFPRRRAEYLRAQAEMFKTAESAGLDTDDRTAMIECICALLGINISSRKQMAPGEMVRFTRMLAAGAVRPGWELEDLEMLEAA